MASEPFFEERSDAVKMSETPYPTNGSGKNLAKDTGIKCSVKKRYLRFCSNLPLPTAPPPPSPTSGDGFLVRVISVFLLI